MPHYRTVADHFVDHRARDLAKQTLELVCTKLQIKPPALRWIADDDFGPEWFAQDVAGFCSKDGNEIVIHKDLNPFSIANTVVHECRHSSQIKNPKRLPMKNRSYTRTMTREQAERDCKIYELEFWNGREKRSGSFDDITRVLTDMQIESARALVQSRQYVFKQRGLPYASSFAYPARGTSRLIVPSEREMEENLLLDILNG